MAANLNAPALPPGFEIQPQQGLSGGALPGERQPVPQAPPAPRMAQGMGQPAAAQPGPVPAAAQGAPALPPGFQLQQPGPAAPKRDVGMGEGIARIVGQSAIPVTRMLGLAASTVARAFGGEEAQDAVFRKTDEAIDSMQRMYEFQPDEEVGMPTQIIGGLVSAPIEVVGGMGVQRGIDRSAEVLQRGGSGTDAAIAGGVTGAANVAANLLPVKAGGAAGRAIERTLGRGLGSRVGQVAGGAATGGAIAAGADYGVAEASNLALPEGEQFADLQQEADPLVSFGVGAAFGGAAARAERRGGRRAAQAAGQPQDTPAPALRDLLPGGGQAGADAPAGSVGAAGVDEATTRRERAAALPVPIELTQGQATRRFEDQQFERETAKNSETGAPLRERFDEQNERLARNFDQFVDMTGAEQTSLRGVGESVVTPLLQKMESRREEITKAYDAAREAGDMAEPVKTDELVAYLNRTGPESINAPVLQTVREKLVQLGGAKRDGEGGLLPGEIPINDIEEIRKMINRVSDSTPTNRSFGAEVKERIDAITADAGGDLYREARRLRTNYGREFNNRAVINDLVRNKRGTADRAVALEDVFDRAILRRSLDDVRHLRRVLQTAGEPGQQAWRELQGQTLRHLQDQALRGAARDQRGNPVVSFDKLNKAVRELDADGRLDFIFGRKGAEQLRDLRDIAADVVTSPPGSVNTSNTGSMLINAIDTMVTFGASGIPVPAFAVLRKAMQSMRERGVRKRVAAALQQPEGLQAGERPGPGRFGDDIDPETGEVVPQTGRSVAETGQSVSPGAVDPRLAEIERLRAATQNPEVLDVLDRRQRKVEAELEANRLQAERATQAEEIDALARSSSDPEIRRALAARAEKLRGGAIPVGEATELDVETIEGRAQGDIPVGEATELPVERVEPQAPRQTAAGSDPDADLTLLQYKRAGESLDDVKKAFDEAGVDHSITEKKGGGIELGRIVVPWERRSKGVGTAAMQRLVDYADATGQRIELGASSQLGGDKARLIEFYERFGFTRKPRTAPANKPFKDTAMVREPKRPAQLSRAGAPKAPDTPEFRNWFKGSKVVDAEGKPLVVYHGTDATFVAFDERKLGQGVKLNGGTRDQLKLSTLGFWFSTRDVTDRTGMPIVMPSYLSIKNPKRYGSVVGGGLADAESRRSGRAWRAQLEAEGYDGAVFEVDEELGGTAWVAFRPEQIKSAIGNRGTFDPKNPDIRYKRAGTEPFYSELGARIDESPMKQGDANAWGQALKGLISSGKVKADEVEWSGLREWLALQPGKVTKQQVADYLEANGVQVKETVLGGRLGADMPAGWRVERADSGTWHVLDDEDAVRGEGDSRDEAIENAQDESESGVGGVGTKYQSYTLPGGENYREVLLTLPDQRRAADGWRFVQVKDLGPVKPWDRGNEEKWAAIAPSGERTATFDTEQAAREYATKHGQPDRSYRSSHWDQPNVLAHIRVNDRTDADGKRVLFVEEVQSDWGQEAKKKGFRRDHERKFEALLAKRNALPEGAERDAAQKEIDAFAGSFGASLGVPDAPFVGSTDKWLALALKRIVKMAVDEGYDRVAFVNGEQSAERYDLSKQVDELVAYDDNTLTARKGGRKVIERPFKDEAELADIIGKDMAAKLLSTKPDMNNQRVLKGQDLKVGGEGMKAFYDRIVPAALKDVLRKVGGGKVGEIRLRNDSDPKQAAADDKLLADLGVDVPEAQPQRQVAFDITDAMRQKAAGGLPLFKRADARKPQRQPGLPAKPFKARAELEDALRAKFGHKLIDGLIKRNVLTMGDAPTDVPRDAQGRFTGSAVELFHDRLDANTAPEVLMHEVGEHYGMQKMLGEKRYAELLDDVRKMRQRPEVAKAWATVRRNYPDLTEGDRIFVSEVAAHLVESGSDRPIVRRMLDAPRAYVYANFGVNVGRNDPGLLRALAAGALRKSAGVEALAANPASLAAASQREKEPAPQ